MTCVNITTEFVVTLAGRKHGNRHIYMHACISSSLHAEMGGWGGRSQWAAKVGNRVDLKPDSTIVTHMVDSQSEILNTWTKRKQQEKKH